MIHFHVTDLDQLTWYHRIESMTAEDLASRLRREAPANESMLIGTAWHSVLEDPPEKIEFIEKNGYNFQIDCDAEISLPQIKEIRADKQYDIDGYKVSLSGGCDGITGNTVYDHKLTFKPNPENYFDSYQWRAYLDIFEADKFIYYPYHAKQDDDGLIRIVDVSEMPLYRYPDMETDLKTGIRNLLSFCREYMPEKLS